MNLAQSENDGSVPWLRGVWERHGEKLRYLIVGGWNTLFGYLLFLLLLELIGHPIASLESSSLPPLAWIGVQYYLVVSWIGWVFAVAQSTLTMKYLVFRKGGSYWKQTFRAYFVYIPSQILGSAILWFLVRVIGLIPQIAALLNIAITVVFSYFGHKYFTFRTPRTAEDVPAEALEPRSGESGEA